MIYVAMPAMDEADLAESLLRLNEQSLLPQGVAVCINQPQSYYQDGVPDHRRICEVNRRVHDQLQSLKAEGRFSFPLYIIDRFSETQAWDAKNFGVGMARKTAMDFISHRADVVDADVLVCMDADTVYPPDYLRHIGEQFVAFPQAQAMANPYYHLVDEVTDEVAAAMLHYEVYMRAYALNLRLTQHPYAFTAVGSSMACTCGIYRKTGGITPFKSGEDFYFLQKLAKTTQIITHSHSLSHPAARLSSRVFFGTGPALQKGLQGQWASHPIYPCALFESLQKIYASLPALFDTETPGEEMRYWNQAFGEGWWKPIKQNSGGRRAQFVHACTEKIDALRSLQFLKASYAQNDRTDWQNLQDLMDGCEAHLAAEMPAKPAFCRKRRVVSLCDLTLQDWQELRHFLFLCEQQMQRHNPLLPSW